MEKNTLVKSGIIGWFKEKWAHNPMLSTLFALIVMKKKRQYAKTVKNGILLKI